MSSDYLFSGSFIYDIRPPVLCPASTKRTGRAGTELWPITRITHDHSVFCTWFPAPTTSWLERERKIYIARDRYIDIYIYIYIYREREIDRYMDTEIDRETERERQRKRET